MYNVYEFVSHFLPVPGSALSSMCRLAGIRTQAIQDLLSQLRVL
jgi:hypothetical protein